MPLTLVKRPADCGKTSWCRGLARDRPGLAGVLTLKLFAAGRRIGYDLYCLATGESLPFARLPVSLRALNRVRPFVLPRAGLLACYLLERAALEHVLRGAK